MAASKKTQSLLNLVLVFGIVLCLNFLGGYIHGYLDLTEDKRFTLTKPTEELLQNLDDVVFVRVLLEGEFPAGFKRLQKSVIEMLNDFRGETGYLEYEFEDPSKGTLEEINTRREELAKDGISPTLFRMKDAEGMEEKLIYPYAIFYYKGRNVAVNLLENQGGQSQELILNNSVSLLEFKFANAIQKLQLSRKQVIAFTNGHGELGELETKDLVNTLRHYYDVGRFNLDSAYQIPEQLDLLIVAKPRAPFSERDKFMIDQYVMRGGKVIWLIDKLNASLDSIPPGNFYVPGDYNLNLDDILFKYGARIDPGLVLDLQCSSIPQVIGVQGGSPQIDLFPWFYHPVVVPKSDNPIVKGLDNVNFFFPSRVELVRTKTETEQTVLLSTSEYSREQLSPLRLSFEILRYEPDPKTFDKGEIPLAVLLEGTFPSLFENRVSESMLDGLEKMNQEFLPESVPTKMVVVGDGDIAANPISRESGGHRPLGYNIYDRKQYANKDFLINCIEYLLDQNGVIAARGKEVKLRLLDTVRAEANKTGWQLLNLGVPLVFLILFGLTYHFWRKRKFAR
ncbi:MAG: gliding motility-associated ABC transporter substrate-binding protein GldG [Saprospiraceae bacterium]|nr:gliding motility-associated ABC transporter substrate-binding protein GldG [Saprospiraceae bacterium]